MTYLQFRQQWLCVGCFSIYQVRAWSADFDRSNLTRWVKNGFLCRLRQDWYAFSELLTVPDIAKFIASRIYSPSYISLHSALSIYGIIPEAVSTITSVTSNRTTSYDNDFGHYTYQTVKPSLFFGYKQVPLSRGGSYLIAEAEKAIIDLLYLYPQYDSTEALLDLRFDEWWMQESLDVDKINSYAEVIGNKSLTHRVKLLFKAYRND